MQLFKPKSSNHRLNDPNRQANVHATIKWSSVLVLLFVLIGAGWFWHHQHNRFTSLTPQRTNPQALLKAVKADSHSNGFTYEVYYRTDCVDCQRLEKAGVVDVLRQAQRQHHLKINYVETATFRSQQPTQATNWFTNNQVTATPTLVVRYKGYQVVNYAGTDVNKWRQLLNGVNPVTHQKLTAQVNKTRTLPTKMSLIDDFHHKTEIISPIKVNTLDN